MKLTAVALLIGLTLVAVGVRGEADTVAMSNGDRLSGSVVSMVGGRLILDTEYAGVLRIAWSKVERVSLDGALAAVLHNGTEIALVEVPTAGLALADVAAIAPPQPDSGWKGRVDLGWTRAQGNRDTQLGTLTAFAERGDPSDGRLSLLVDAAQGRSEGERTASRARAEGKLAQDAGRADYRYWLAGLGYDRVRDIDLRVELGAGVGRTLADRPGHRLTAEIGVSVVRESFDDGESETDAKLRIGQAWERELGAGTSLRQSLSLLSAVEDPEDITAELVVALGYRLTNRLSLVSRVVNTYDTRPAAGTKRNDLTLATQLGFSFGD
jgi:putative salt-induced outer membrane protein YdiY